MKSKLVEKEMVETVGKKNGEADDFKKYLRDKPTSPYFKIKCLPNMIYQRTEGRNELLPEI